MSGSADEAEEIRVALGRLDDEPKIKLYALQDNYDFPGANNDGGNGVVFFAKNKILGHRVAIKFYESDSHLEPRLLLEVKSQYILEVLDAGSAGGSWAYFVTPFCPGGSLDRRLLLAPYDQVEALRRFCDLAEGVAELHRRRYVHRDLKPGNIFVADDRLVIGDFGSLIALKPGEDLAVASQHARIYRPPEAVLQGKYGIPGDIYQCGMSLYQMLGGKLPYEEMAWLSPGEQKNMYR